MAIELSKLNLAFRGLSDEDPEEAADTGDTELDDTPKDADEEDASLEEGLGG